MEHALACCGRKREALHDCTCVCARALVCVTGHVLAGGAPPTLHLLPLNRQKFAHRPTCAAHALCRPMRTCRTTAATGTKRTRPGVDGPRPGRRDKVRAFISMRDRREGRRMTAGGCTTRYVVRQVCRVYMTGVRGTTRVRAADRRKVVVRVDHRASQHAGTRASEERKRACTHERARASSTIAYRGTTATKIDSNGPEPAVTALTHSRTSETPRIPVNARSGGQPSSQHLDASRAGCACVVCVCAHARTGANRRTGSAPVPTVSAQCEWRRPPQPRRPEGPKQAPWRHERSSSRTGAFKPCKGYQGQRSYLISAVRFRSRTPALPGTFPRVPSDDPPTHASLHEHVRRRTPPHTHQGRECARKQPRASVQAHYITRSVSVAQGLGVLVDAADMAELDSGALHPPRAGTRVICVLGPERRGAVGTRDSKSVLRMGKGTYLGRLQVARGFGVLQPLRREVRGECGVCRCPRSTRKVESHQEVLQQGTDRALTVRARLRVKHDEPARANREASVGDPIRDPANRHTIS